MRCAPTWPSTSASASRASSSPPRTCAGWRRPSPSPPPPSPRLSRRRATPPRPPGSAPPPPPVVDDAYALYFRPGGRELTLVALEDGNEIGDFSPDRETASTGPGFAARGAGRLPRRMPPTAVGASLAELICEGRSTTVDLAPYALARFAEGRPLIGEHAYEAIWR